MLCCEGYEMIRSVKRAAAIGIAFASIVHAFGAAPVDINFSNNTGSTEFRATGHPHVLHVVGKGSGPSGDIHVTDKVASGVLNFDLISLDSGIEMRDEHMKNKYLEVGKYPKAQLTIAKLQLPQEIAGKPFVITEAPFQGTLLLHGVSKPIVGTVTLKGDGVNALALDSKFSLKLSDFGIEIPSYAGVTIADDVQVNVVSTPHIATK